MNSLVASGAIDRLAVAFRVALRARAEAVWVHNARRRQEQVQVVEGQEQEGDRKFVGWQALCKCGLDPEQGVCHRVLSHIVAYVLP